MRWNFFGRKPQYVDVESEEQGNRKRHRAVIIMIIAAICLLAFSGSGEKKAGSEVKDSKGTLAELNLAEYTSETEERLKAVLSEISGAGDVKVMVSFDAMNEKILAKNSKNENTSDTEEGKSTASFGSEENIMIYGSGSEEQPFVLKEKLPVPSGVLVLAAGAADETVRLEIYEAVKALYGISGHRIKVAQLGIK